MNCLFFKTPFIPLSLLLNTPKMFIVPSLMYTEARKVITRDVSSRTKYDAQVQSEKIPAGASLPITLEPSRSRLSSAGGPEPKSSHGKVPRYGVESTTEHKVRVKGPRARRPGSAKPWNQERRSGLRKADRATVKERDGRRSDRQSAMGVATQESGPR